jgi:hypothetical protein
LELLTLQVHAASAKIRHALKHAQEERSNNQPRTVESLSKRVNVMVVDGAFKLASMALSGYTQTKRLS